jgi:DNA polymerase elongation subunit (family B)
MISGGSNIEVKKHNDHIIGGHAPWDFPFIKGKRKMFKSFDLKDDIPDPGISLKAIEGNLKLPIVESSVPFDIDRPLNKKELEESIRYCKYDVDSTVRLYNERKEDYLDAKILVGDMYGVPPEEAIGLTNAKLSARVLEAEYVERNDERDYVIPENIDVSKIPKIVLDFFMQIRDKSIPDTKLFGAGKGSKGMTLKLWIKTAVGKCPVTFAWGGVHGAKPCVTVEETDDRVIVNQDVGSLYPNSMINFGYCSRSMKDPEAYVKLVQKRLGYKKAKDTKRANALKLVVNTVYGAMLNLYNALADRWAGRSVCISNQLAMMVLITQLAEQCKTIDFININTDGIMFTIDRNEVELSEAIIATWSEITRFEMERDDFVKVIQKDVNNYIGIKAEIDPKTGKRKMKTKGGYVSLYEKGNFKTNSLQIIHKAIVDYLVDGIEPETTIGECKDIFAFQQIVKTGSTYEGSYQYINGERVPIQKVNRIYAVKDTKYGQVLKGKWITAKRKKDKATGK